MCGHLMVPRFSILGGLSILNQTARFGADELIAYFGEIKLPYHIVDGCVCIAGEVDRDSVFKWLEKFYECRAEVLPF
jgi:acyl-[acyl carrier protein]--UDP-N-acetylglucosamine O-acyltransferase